MRRDETAQANFEVPIQQPHPLYFGTGGRASLFGWYHAPAGRRSDPAEDQFGVVICNPFGFEEICAHRSIRQLASELCADGIPTLRFDYYGCGDSAGDEFTEDLLGAWIASIDSAVDQLKAASGVDLVVLVGFRLGAALAVQAARERSDIGGIVAISPVIQGRTYLRQLKLFGRTGVVQTGGKCDDGSVHAGGYLLSGATVRALAKVDLLEAEGAPVSRVLVVESPDAPAKEQLWAADLKRAGVEVAIERWGGYREMTTDPQLAKPAREIFDGVRLVLSQWNHSRHQFAGSAAEPKEHSGIEVGRSVRESAVWIDTGVSRLFGILAQRDDTKSESRPAVVMLNSGSVHHVGPNRLWVRLARQWASKGFIVLRIDLSGIGDSPTRPGAQDNVVYSPYAEQDLRSVLQYLHQEVRGVSGMHLLGLCSGAYHAFRSAVSGLPIDTAVVVNPLTYHRVLGTVDDRQLKAYEIIELSRGYRRKVLTREAWEKFMRRNKDLRTVFQVVTRRLWVSIAYSVQEVARTVGLPLRNDLLSELRAAVQRGVMVHFVFAENDPGMELLFKQCGRKLHDLLDRQAIKIDVVADADHTFTPMVARQRLVDLLDGLPQFQSTESHAQGDGGIHRTLPAQESEGGATA